MRGVLEGLDQRCTRLVNVLVCCHDLTKSNWSDVDQ